MKIPIHVRSASHLTFTGSIKNIENECRKKTYWICEKDCEITILFSKGLELTYKIKAGYVTDFASIPSFARGVINDTAIVAAQAIKRKRLYLNVPQCSSSAVPNR